MNKLFDNLLEFCIFYFSGTGQKNSLQSQKKVLSNFKKKKLRVIQFQKPEAFARKSYSYFWVFFGWKFNLISQFRIYISDKKKFGITVCHFKSKFRRREKLSYIEQARADQLVARRLTVPEIWVQNPASGPWQVGKLVWINFLKCNQK